MTAPEATGTLAERLRALLVRERAAMLSTLSVHVPGWPFGSVTPFAVTAAGDIVLVLSDLAEHTKNLKSDPRASLLVTDHASWDDPQSGARATLLGAVTRCTDPAVIADARSRWNARLPPGRAQLETPDFGTYILAVERVRFVAGFGAMRWMDAAELRR